MKDPKVLTIQDISCVGQCSLTVALPVISACGVETCILPSAVLSTHTAFSSFTFRDLTEDMPAIAEHWKKENLLFDAVYTGYLGSALQIRYVSDIMDTMLVPGGKKIVDPAMADNGKLYTGFDCAFVKEMAALCGRADIVLPNITEASFMTGMPCILSGYDEAYIRGLMQKVAALGAKTVVLTGVSYEAGKLGVAVYDSASGVLSYYLHEKCARSSHGTGDIFASAFTGSLMRGRSVADAAKIAADYVVACIRATEDDASHWYGVKFEKAIPVLVRSLEK